MLPVSYCIDHVHRILILLFYILQIKWLIASKNFCEFGIPQFRQSTKTVID